MISRKGMISVPKSPAPKSPSGQVLQLDLNDQNGLCPHELVSDQDDLDQDDLCHQVTKMTSGQK